MLRRRFLVLSFRPYDIEDYLTITALEDNFQISIPDCFYSINGGGWIEYKGGSTIPINTGDFYCFKKEAEENTTIGRFTIDQLCNISGNIMSMIYGDKAKGKTSLNGCSFTGMFLNCAGIKEVNQTLLPATTLVSSCYHGMFRGCTGLIQAPKLPATTLAYRCYGNMFYGCISLTQAPELPATTAALYCYDSMFNSCINLTQAPELPATTLANSCYTSMFLGCTSLLEAPELPATTLAESCYTYMFYDCINLTQAPELPATTLAFRCYGNMFQGCTNLSYIKMLAPDISVSYCLLSWVKGVSPTGTFVKSKDATWDTTPNALRDSGVPAGWAVITEEEESNPLNVILNINANNGEEGVRVYNYISEKAPWISSAFDNLFIEGLYEGSMLSAKVVSAIFMGNTLVLSYEGQGHYDMCNLFPDGYLELVFND